VVKVSKAAYEGWTDKRTIGFGDGHDIEAKLTSSGIRVTFKLTNYVTGKPVAGARLQLGDADVVSGADGTVVASVSASFNNQAEVASITDTGFNDATAPIIVATNADTTAVKLVPAGKVYFLSNRSGHVDLYSANLDDSAAKVVLAGTGNEDQATGILPNVYDQSVIALVSSRAGHRTNGALVEDLYIFRPDSQTLTLVDSDIDFGNYRAWLGKQLIYVKYSGNNHTFIQSYDPTSGKNTTLVTCTGDGACPTPLYTTDDLFIYSLSGAPPSSNANGIYALKSGTTTAKSISTIPAATTVRQTKNTLLLNYYDYTKSPGNYEEWQSLDLSAIKVTTLANGPSNQDSRTYVDSPGDKYSVSVDTRDGQTDLYLTNIDGSGEKNLTGTGKVNQFVQWYSDSYIVFSSSNQLFVVGVDGGDPQKITNFYSGDVQVFAGGYNPGGY
jgi:Tol biopolymer transport system component